MWLVSPVCSRFVPKAKAWEIVQFCQCMYLFDSIYVLHRTAEYLTYTTVASVMVGGNPWKTYDRPQDILQCTAGKEVSMS